MFWETICAEHNVDEGDGRHTADDNIDPNSNAKNNKLEKINVYFEETGRHRYVPRSILVDLEPGVLDMLKARKIGKLFKPDNFIFGQSGAGNNWALAHYQDGPELIDEICDVIRREMESCDCPQGVQITQSCGGGTGSGLGSLIQLKLREHYPDRIINSFSVYPSKKVSDVVVEPYNTILTMPMLLQDCDQVNVIDNEALFEISTNLLKQKDPKFHDLNWVISLVMGGITSSLRFPGQLNSDLRKQGVNLVPFPRLHFFTIAAAPLFSLTSGKESSHVNLTIREVLDQLWSGKNFLSKININDGRYLSTATIFRGENVKTWEVENEQRELQDKLMEDFVNWIPNNIMTSCVGISTKYSNMNGSFIGNFTGISSLFRRVSRQFHKMFKKKAFLHWYIGVGMDELEIKEAHKNTQDLIQELQEKNDVIVDEDNPYNYNYDDSDEPLLGDSSTDDDKKANDSDSGGIIADDSDSDSGGIIEDDDD